MRKHQWLSSVRESIVQKKNRNFRRRNRKQSLEFRSLEPRNLLASVSFDVVENVIPVLSFNADAGEVDVVSVSGPTEDTLQIQVGGGDSIELTGDTADNSAFVLSQSQSANDTLTINLSDVDIEVFSFNLGDLDDVFTVTSLPTFRTEFGFPAQTIVVDGGNGNDILDASPLTTFGVQLFGGNGDDQLTGGSGDDVLAGGGGTDIIDGGLGSDTNSFADITTGVTATITEDGSGTAEYGQVSEIFVGIENLEGSDNDDVLTGNDSDNAINGRQGNDIITGLGGDDFLFGGEAIENGFTLSVLDQPLASLTTQQSPTDLVLAASNDELFLSVAYQIGGQLLLQSDSTENGVRTLTLSASLGESQVPNIESDFAGTGNASVIITVAGEDVSYSVDLSVSDILASTVAWSALSDVDGDGISGITINDTSAGTDGPVIVDVVQDAGGGPFGNVLTGSEFDTGDGNVFVETFVANNNTINGGAGNDEILGGAGDDIIDGGDGDDLIQASTGDDILNGGAGNDSIYGFDGDDIINGGDGDDVLNGGFGNDSLDGGAGSDTNSFTSFPTSVTAEIDADGTGIATSGTQSESFVGIENLTGSENDDTLIGNDLANVIDGGLGNDSIFGLGGDDIIFSGPQQVGIVVSTPTTTELTTLEPLGELTAEEFVEEAIAGNLYVNIYTNDFPNGEIRGQFVLETDTDRDGTRSLFLSADIESDSDVTGVGSLQLEITGTDVVIFSSISVEGVLPQDLLPVFGLSSILIQNAPPGADGPPVFDVVQSAGGDINGNAIPSTIDSDDGNVFRSILSNASGETSSFFVESEDDDIVNGGTGNDTIRGGIGNDILRGGAGEDIAIGGFGDDTINGGSGNDTLSGSAGDDFFVGIGGTDSIDGGAGNDTNSFQGIGSAVTATINADGSGTASYAAVEETFVGIENLTGSENDDVLTVVGSFNSVLRGFGGDDLLTGGDGDDFLIGNDGNDILRGIAGNDTIFGGGGNDNLNGGGGNDNLQGNEGNDFFVGIGGVDVIDGGLGFDTNSFQGVADGVTASINDDGTGNAEHGEVSEFFTGIDLLVGSANDDFLAVTGSRDTQLIGLDGDDILIGGLGDDVLIGGNGNDIIFGEQGNDTINAGSGDDFARGDQGDDSIAGGAGNDRLAGSEGDDDLFGNEGDDFLFGADGNDLIVGNGGDDELRGGDDDDELLGGDGDDELFGGLGIDELFGGNGTDEETQ